MNPADILHRFETALPLVRAWIDETLAGHHGRAVPLRRMGWNRLVRIFPADLLDRAAGVVVDGDPPFPPLTRMGLPELAAFEAMPIDAVTYKDVFFVRRGQWDESLSFHEMVHVAQWDRLGADRFLLAYGIGLVQSGYAESPLEAMAYALQADFDRQALRGNLMATIHRETDAVWQAASRLLAAAP